MRHQDTSRILITTRPQTAFKLDNINKRAPPPRSSHRERYVEFWFAFNSSPIPDQTGHSKH
jgi:hypothetical protein